MIKKITSIMLIFTMLYITAIPSIASNLTELQEQKEEAENKKEEVTQEKESVLDEISELNSQISQYENEIGKLNNDIENLESSITDKEEEIKELEKEIEDKKDMLIKRLVAMYEAGQTTYLDALLGSEDITSLISNYYRIEEIAEADQSVIDSIKKKQQKTEETKQELENEKEEVNSAKKEVQQKSNQLEKAKLEKEEKVDSLSEEEKELQQTIDDFEEAIKKAKEEIKNSVNSSSGYEGSFEGMFSWPLDYSENQITSVFGRRDAPTMGASENHGAIDIGVNYVPVYAPADGKVIIARWLSGYGNYIMIDHGDGYYTGFGHLNSYNVSQGQTVSRGQQIAISGSTGISTGPHLHYEVYIGGIDNWYRVDPLLYTSHPSLIL